MTRDLGTSNSERMIKNVGQGLEPSRTAGDASKHNRRAVAEAGTTRDEADTIGEQQQKLVQISGCSSST